ncbi:MAG: ABC transporter substrate-binding protein [Hyphomicrobiales bacterium]|nr:MAG: ABC transporter substrate-binding protein [Hyphomicrobiales bacterium]
MHQRFHHNGLVVRPDAGITLPKDIEGKKVGVRAYSVTGGVWTRGVLQNEYGVDPAKVNWIVDDEEHVEQLRLPPNVQHAPEGKSLASMMRSGEIQAAFLGNAGIGREGPPSETWGVATEPPAAYRELIADPAADAAAWFARTGVLPTHGTVVIRDEVVAANPDVPRILFDALVESKARYLDRLRSGDALEPEDAKLLKLMDVVGPDPIPYGISANWTTMEMLVTYAVQQKLLSAPISVDELFFDFDRTA